MNCNCGDNWEIEGMPKAKAIYDEERGLCIIYLETKIDRNTTNIKIIQEIKIGNEKI